MTIYTHDQSDTYIDENAVTDFVDDNAEAVILADGGDGGGDDTGTITIRYVHEMRGSL